MSMYDEYEDEYDERVDGPTILVNGSTQPLEVGANFLNSVKSVALQAGFGKFKVFLNGTEVRPTAMRESHPNVLPDDRVEIRPFDEAGKGFYWTV